MRTALMFIRAFSDLMVTTRHMTWLLRLRYMAASFSLYRRESRALASRHARPSCGNPAVRASCCMTRPAAYPDTLLPADIPELAGLLTPAGTAWGGYIQFFDCTVCGQEWMLDWQPATHGGSRQLKKVLHQHSHP